MCEEEAAATDFLQVMLLLLLLLLALLSNLESAPQTHWTGISTGAHLLSLGVLVD